jgi:thiamine kinase-like enzyme
MGSLEEVLTHIKDSVQLELRSVLKIEKTKNECHKLVDQQDKHYFIKISKPHNIQREMQALSFYKRHDFVMVPNVVSTNGNYILMDYVRDLSELGTKETVSELANLHKKLIRQNDFEEFSNNETYETKSREKALRRVDKYSEIIEDFWDRPSQIKDFLKETRLLEYKELPKILNHGDPHRWNIKKSPEGEVMMFDFEFATYSEPTFDIARNIASEHPEDFYDAIGTYVDEMKDSELGKLGDKKLIRLILYDTLAQVISRAVTFKKIAPESPRTIKSMEKFRQLLEQIFD